MRLLLDAHVSGRRIAPTLRELGHDVRAVNEERSLDGYTDEEILALAFAEDRILITFNARDFARISREWAEVGRSHAGCAILVAIDHGEFGVILRRLGTVLSDRSDPHSWRDYTCFVARSG